MNELSFEKQKELEVKIKNIIEPYVLETTTLGELDHLASALMYKIRDWNEKVESRCRFCYGILDCTSDHK